MRRGNSDHYRQITSQRGSMLISVMISAAILVTVLMALLPAFNMHTANAQRINMSLSGTLLRTNIKTLLENQAAWNAMKAASGPGTCNQHLECVKDGTDCAALLNGQPGPETGPQHINCLFDVDGQLIYDRRIATNGFDDGGRPCNTFSDTNPDPACPFHPKVCFSLDQCTIGNCTGKPMKIFVWLEMSKPDGVVLNESKFDMVLQR